MWPCVMLVYHGRAKSCIGGYRTFPLLQMLKCEKLTDPSHNTNPNHELMPEASSATFKYSSRGMSQRKRPGQNVPIPYQRDFCLTKLLCFYSQETSRCSHISATLFSVNKHSTWRQEFLGRGSENLEQSNRLSAAAWHWIWSS